jgi:hypothetical protein
MQAIRRLLQLSVALGVGLACVQPLAAADREYILKWTQPDAATVQGYRVHVSQDATTPQTPESIDIGAVQPDADGIGRFPLLLPAEVGHHLSMTAYNSTGESAESNEIFVAASFSDPASCDDANLCTADDSTSGGCTHAAFSDGTFCGVSGEICLSGACSVAECLIDADCADANVCDGSMRCEGYVCVVATAALDCGTPPPCQTALCDARSGCLTRPLADGTSCDDGNAATRRDQCRSGTCAGFAKKGRGWSR